MKSKDQYFLQGEGQRLQPECFASKQTSGKHRPTVVFSVEWKVWAVT